ncbi:MAG: hypothetical protein HY710_06855 [Candidatus Latescibacteria bacterium]|nr:hypothetical protein [Candidatus Latescibacterota bacterium]
MLYLDVFITHGCPSEDEARRLAESVSRTFTNVTVAVRNFLDDEARAAAFGVFVVPAFVLDGQIIGMGPINPRQLYGAILRRGGILASQNGQTGQMEPDQERSSSHETL